jgi:transposase
MVVAAMFISVVDDATCFKSAHYVQSYLVLVPSESATGGKRKLGAISIQGNSYGRLDVLALL